MRLALSSQGATHASVASYNNHWGVPLTLARMPRDSDFGIFEIGMNHEGEIRPLTALVRPHVAIVTTIEPVHIEFFRSIWSIADAKGEIFSGMETGRHGGSEPGQPILRAAFRSRDGIARRGASSASAKTRRPT